MNKLHILTLLNTKGINKNVVAKIMLLGNVPFDIHDLHAYLESLKVTNDFIKIPERGQLLAGQEIANKIIEKSESEGIKILSQLDEGFPDRLKTIPNSPLLIHVKGDVNCLNNKKSIAVIGTRKPTDYANRISKLYSQKFAESKIDVISGLARGCDTNAHKGCIEAGGKTIAVLAGGLDTINPTDNIALAENIIDSGGALISEYQIGTLSKKNYFVERNRLQCGLSKALLVIETDINGGSMHTVRFAKVQDRPIYVDYTELESRLDLNIYQGNKYLAENNEGFPIQDINDIYNLINFILAD
jgi:DNA processing protein